MQCKSRLVLYNFHPKGRISISVFDSALLKLQLSAGQFLENFRVVAGSLIVREHLHHESDVLLSGARVLVQDILGSSWLLAFDMLHDGVTHLMARSPGPWPTPSALLVIK